MGKALVVRKDGLGVVADAARYARRTFEDSREIDAHETEDHIMGDVGNVVRDHVRCVENLRAGTCKSRSRYGEGCRP